jgi:hypothetical protein
MPAWIADQIVAIFILVPALLVAEDQPKLMLIRVMIGLLLIVLVVYVIVTQPVRSAISRCAGKRLGACTETTVRSAASVSSL